MDDTNGNLISDLHPNYVVDGEKEDKTFLTLSIGMTDTILLVCFHQSISDRHINQEMKDEPDKWDI